ncbi:MAG: helix-turn-helix domain-containing protein [Alphaproteobacteria bacterium]
MHKDIMALMSRLGLKDKESKIYLSCLSHKDGLFIFEIAKQTGLTRSTVDLIVRRLLKRGFLNKVKVGRRLRFFAQSPEAVLFKQKQLVEDFEKVVPILSKIAGEKKDMEILYFEGAQGFKQVHDDALLQMKFASGEKKHMMSFASGYDSIRLYPNMQKGFIDKRIKNGSWYKTIAPASSAKVKEWTNDPKFLRAAKYLPDDNYPFHIDIQIYADSMMIYSTVPPIGGVTIRNEQVADSMRALFNLVWRLLPDKN